MKTIDLSKTVYELVNEYPQLTDILADLGFKEITKKAMLNSMGKIMTIPKGSKVKNIPLEKVIKTLEANDFTVTGIPTSDEPDNKQAKSVQKQENNSQKNSTAKIKEYLNRLNKGEDLEAVKAEFVKEFSDVAPSEIMKAEQEIISEGTPLEEVQKLCDVHSALFHGNTREEKIANAEIAVAKSLNKISNAIKLIDIPGHPLNTFTKENDAVTSLIENINNQILNQEDITDNLEKLTQISVHYKKKGDLLYPHLKVKYDISGPHQVMWTVDNEIKDELIALTKEENHNEEWISKVQAVLGRMEEMIYKETNILFPILEENFTESDWQGIYFDSKDYSPIFDVNDTSWEIEEGKKDLKVSEVESDIVIPGGHLTKDQLEGLMRTLPIEVTFIDDQDINRYFNEGPKVFKRPLMALDREVYSCHPPKVEPIVRNIINDFKNKKRDSVAIWMEKENKPFLVNYMAVRDNDGNYIGTAEFVQDMAFARDHFNKENQKNKN